MKEQPMGAIERVASSYMLTAAVRVSILLGTLLLGVITYTAARSYEVIRDLIVKVDTLSTMVAVQQAVQSSQTEAIRQLGERVIYLERGKR